MKYGKIVEGVFIARPNRFIAHVMVENEMVVAHVKNTGRCLELLVKGCRVYLEKAENPSRKTPYDLVAVVKEREGDSPLLINMDSQVVNGAVEEFLKSGNLFENATLIRREVTWGNSRFDFYIETPGRKIFLEVKGVTLENSGVASFPDAPTERGIKHLGELISCQNEEYEAYVLFVIQMKGVHVFVPNDERHAAFGVALREAAKQGVNVLAYDCHVTPDTITLDKPVKVTL